MPRFTREQTTPVKIKKASAQELRISWSDGVETMLVAPRMRGLCPCASCQDEVTGMRIVLPIHIPDDLELRTIQLVGQYAIRVEFSDGHHTGLYSFDYLRELGSEASVT